jgi:hypothetical protein
MFGFKCPCCNDWHEGMPTFAADAPLYLYGIAEQERAKRCVLHSDTCVIDDKLFFVRGCIEIPVDGVKEPSSGACGCLSVRGALKISLPVSTRRNALTPGRFFGWLAAELPLYPSTENLKTRVHLRDDGVRPYIELEPTDHPLAIEQRNGIAVDRVAEIYVLRTRSAIGPRLLTAFEPTNHHKNKNAASPKESGVLFDRDT